MDKKKKIIRFNILFISLLFAWVLPTLAQDVNTINIKEKYYEYGVGNDSITLFLKFLNSQGKSCNEINDTNLEERFDLVEDGNTIPKDQWQVRTLTEGRRIPKDFTISVLVDLSIPQNGKKDIYDAVQTLVESTNDSCVYLSFFGDYVSNTRMVTKKNYKQFYNQFQETAENKFFYSALYAKLSEFNFANAEFDPLVKT